MSWIPHALSLELRKLLSYRVDFWAGFLGTLVGELGLAYFLWKAVFEARGVVQLEGYSFRGIMLYYLLIPLLGRMMRGNEMGLVSDDIYDGGLTRYLLYPLSFLQYKYIAHLAFSLIAGLQFLAAFALFVVLVGAPPEVKLGIVQFGLGLVAVWVGSVLYFLMLASVEMVSFWQDNVWSLSVMLKFILMLLGGGLVPIAFFPEAVRPWLEWLPFHYVVSFPVNCMMGSVSIVQWLSAMGMAALWIGVFGLLTNWIWRRGVRQYSGVGI